MALGRMSSVAAGVAVATLAYCGAAQANLLTNGSFENPLLGPGNSCGGSFTYCRGYNPDLGLDPSNPNYIAASDVPGWFTIGSGGSKGPGGTTNDAVLLLGSFYTEVNGTNGNPLHFTAGHGQQSLDLTGAGNQGANGVKQSVATSVGKLYSLSFMIGNQDDTAAGYELDSSIELFINGLLVDTFVNQASTADDLNWITFSLTFAATDALTTIAFLSSTPVGDNMAGLDNVVLVEVAEPATALLLATGLVGFGRRRRDSVAAA